MDKLRIEEKKINGRTYYDVLNGIMQIPGGPYSSRQQAEDVVALWRKKFAESEPKVDASK